MIRLIMKDQGGRVARVINLKNNDLKVCCIFHPNKKPGECLESSSSSSSDEEDSRNAYERPSRIKRTCLQTKTHSH